MDPNATLKAIGEAESPAEASYLCESLYAWISKGGFEPDWFYYPKASRYYDLWKKVNWK